MCMITPYRFAYIEDKNHCTHEAPQPESSAPAKPNALQGQIQLPISIQFAKVQSFDRCAKRQFQQQFRSTTRVSNFPDHQSCIYRQWRRRQEHSYLAIQHLDNQALQYPEPRPLPTPVDQHTTAPAICSQQSSACTAAAPTRLSSKSNPAV